MTLFKKTILPSQTIGIIGGGQLGRMMAIAAKQMGFKVAVLDPTRLSPCGQIADYEITASYDDREALEKLAKISDVITYEFENIDYQALKWLTDLAYIPQGAELIRITQDRVLEKSALLQAGVNVAPYEVIEDSEQLLPALQKLGYPAVLKTARGGYDGKGQYVIRSERDIDSASKLLKQGTCVLEKWLSFERELSVIVCRNVDGERATFPVVENIHVDNILHQTIAPARIDQEIQAKAIHKATLISETLDLVGTLAIEMFLTSEGDLYINELAPRPHNSGHYSIEACDHSQFSHHIRAICNWSLEQPTLLKPAVMINVLGEHIAPLQIIVAKRPNWFVHLYGKDQAKEKRKMGHITLLTNDIKKTLHEIELESIWNIQEKVLEEQS